MSTSTSALQRLRVKLPAGFVPSRHTDAMTAKVIKAHGEGYVLQDIDEDAGVAIFVRGRSVTTVEKGPREETFRLQLASSTKPTDAQKIASMYEDQYKGFYLTEFDPYLYQAQMTKLTPEAVRCRGAVANALSVKPWEVQITSLDNGGFDLVLPRSYTPSKHDDKLTEVATEIVGQAGWRFLPNPAKLTATISPGLPPTFPGGVGFPMERLGELSWDHSILGVTLPEEGEGVGPEIVIDWTQSAWALVAGLPGGGKSVTLNSLIAQQLASGAQLVIVDDAAKAVDFMWCRDFVRPGGWGCDSEAAAATALALVYEEGQRRAKVLSEKGVVNWLDLPREERFQKIFIVVDEVSALLVQDPVPKGVPKDHPIVTEINQLNFMRALIGRFINKIIAEQRFVGICMVLSTQVTNAQTGLPPSVKNKIGHRALQGVNPSKSARDQAFNDANAVPLVPEPVKNSGNGARGVGVCDLTGQAPAVYKSLFAQVQDYRQALLDLGVPQTDAPAPTAAQIAKHAPALDDDVERADTPSGKPLDPKFGPVESFNEDGKRIFGAAAAASASKKLAPSDNMPLCPTCGKPIHPDGRCGCSV